MPSPRRRPKVYTAGDLTTRSLAERPYWALAELAEKGVISWLDVREALAERSRNLNGGTDPYAHLREMREGAPARPSRPFPRHPQPVSREIDSETHA